jgi:hypothetical protein
MNKPAFIVGNGVSRNSIDLNQLVGQAPIYGCNALYRDFDKWDYLVSIDHGMISEIRNSEGLYGDGIVIVPPEDQHYESLEYSPYRRRNNAGMVAMDTAIRRGFDILYLIGIDFILKGDISTDNVYKNTENYGPQTHATQDDNFYRMKYFEWFVRKNENIKFVFVLPEDCQVRPIDSDNVMKMTTTTFKNKLK